MYKAANSHFLISVIGLCNTYPSDFVCRDRVVWIWLMPDLFQPYSCERLHVGGLVQGCSDSIANALELLVVVILFPTEYKQWRTEHMSNITTTINIDDPVGGHQKSQRLIGLATCRCYMVLGMLGHKIQKCDLNFQYDLVSDNCQCCQMITTSVWWWLKTSIFARISSR